MTDAETCIGRTRSGKPCGNRRLADLQVCRLHIPGSSADEKKEQTLVERLRQGGNEALHYLRRVVGDEDVAAETRVRASEILLSRIAPKLSSQHAVIVSVGGDTAAGPLKSSADLIRARLELLGEPAYDLNPNQASEAQAQVEDLAWKVSPEDPADEIVEAELVPEPEPSQVQEPAARPYGVPPMHSRPTTFERIAGQRHSA